MPSHPIRFRTAPASFNLCSTRTRSLTSRFNSFTTFSLTHPATSPPDAGAAEEPLEREDEKEELRKEIESFLEAELKELFGCLWAGVKKPAEIARRLGVDPREVIKARKRLDRRMREFARRRRCLPQKGTKIGKD
jgi:hypothetical protein